MKALAAKAICLVLVLTGVLMLLGTPPTGPTLARFAATWLSLAAGFILYAHITERSNP